MIGSTLGRYEILAALGSGGMGEVYRARDGRLGREVALKVLPARLASDAVRCERFEREARAAAALDHPNIVTIHSIERAGGQYFMTMQLVRGAALSTLIPAQGFSLAELFKIAIPLVDAIAAAHREGITHRDLKPANVLVAADGTVKVVDFGLAKLKEDHDAADGPTLLAPPAAVGRREALTEEGTILGTVAYMSPEQAEGRRVDHRTDIFSLGIILYELATGERPFKGESKISVLSSILRDTPPPITELKPRLPRHMARIVKHALEKDLARRYQAVLDLRNDLEELQQEIESGELSQPAEMLPAAPPRRRRRWPLWLGAAALAALALTAGWRYAVLPKPALPAPRVLPLTSLVGSERDPAISPDGTHVAFVWDGEPDTGLDLYVLLIGSPEPLRLTSSADDAFVPAWSPGGGEIAFLRGFEGGGFDLAVIPALGGVERVVGRVAYVGFRGLDWSPDGRYFAVVDRDSAAEGESIFLLSTSTGERRRLTTPPTGGVGDRSPTFSPDGRSLAFVRWYEAPKTEVFLAPLEGGEPRRLLAHEGWIRDLDWLPDGTGLLFSTGSTPGLWRLSLDGESRQLAFGENAWGLSVAGAQERLVYSQRHADSNIWRVSGPAATRPSPPQRLIASSRQNWAAQYSPDGSRIALSSDRSGEPRMWICDAEGRECSMVATDGLAILPRWSPDGKRLVFGSHTGGNPDISVVEADGGFPRPLLASVAMEAAWSWSPDGEWIYYFSDRGGEYQIWRLPVAGGESQQVTRGGGLLPAVSADGRFVYYLRMTTPVSFWRVPAEGGEEEKLLQKRGLTRSGFELWGRSLVYPLEPESGGPSIESYDLDTGRTTTIAALGDDTRLAKYGRISISPDGRWIVYPREDGGGSDIMLVEGFR